MRSMFWSAAAVIGVAFGNVFAEDEKPVALDKLPKAVTEAVKKMFPKAELVSATMEQEKDETEYEVLVKDNGKKITITVEADGEIEELEKEVDLKDLPKAVLQAVEKKYPKAVPQSAEAIYEIEDGKEEFEYYEVQVKTADGKMVEVKAKADGTIVVDEEEEKDEKPKK